VGLRTITVRGTELACLEAGEGPLALCLHGFPDTARTWRHLLPRLADAGFHAVAPFNRGYAPSAVPEDGFHQSGAVAADANALHEALGGDADAVLVGHDWGAVAAYGAAGSAPERWCRLTTLAIPPPNEMMAAFLGYDQLKLSWYIHVFQSPLAELLVTADDLSFLDRLWQDWSPGYDATEDLPAVKDALRGEGHLTAALGIYRASLGNAPLDADLAVEQAACGALPPQPTHYLHGETDGCLSVVTARSCERAFDRPGSRFEVLPEVGHWLHLEAPDAVNDRIVDFLTT
jgi:pimeloyl-ACP methyl ester carboxylesterase